jgi:hypothetical protein
LEEVEIYSKKTSGKKWCVDLEGFGREGVKAQGD